VREVRNQGYKIRDRATLLDAVLPERLYGMPQQSVIQYSGRTIGATTWSRQTHQKSKGDLFYVPLRQDLGAVAELLRNR
jgi:hypothetical protein